MCKLSSLYGSTGFRYLKYFLAYRIRIFINEYKGSAAVLLIYFILANSAVTYGIYFIHTLEGFEVSIKLVLYGFLAFAYYAFINILKRQL